MTIMEEAASLLNDSKGLYPPHPFYPLGAVIEGYVDNDISVPILLASFAVGSMVILYLTYLITQSVNPKLRNVDVAAVMWLTLSGLIHLFFEGYYSLNFKRMGAMQDLFGQLWKEYARSDSRYMTNDAFVMCMETITAFAWGPLCLFVAYCILTNNHLRYPLQALVSLGQIYGDVLYYAICMFNLWLSDISYSRPEAVYFWIYFVAINAIWIVIPGALIYQSVTTTARAFRALERMDTSLKAKKGL